VRITREGGRIVVTVVENQVINRVAFEGNRKVKDEVFLAAVESKPRGPYNTGTVQGDVQRILEVYRRNGRFDATVQPKTITQPNGRVDLVFEVNEGERTGVSAINFIGNQAFSDKTLEDQMVITRTNWLSWLTRKDVYDPDKLNADLELIRKFYINRGYADFRIVSAVADLDRERNAFFITITVDEGKQYRFGKVDIESTVPGLDAATLRGELEASPGQTYSAKAVDETVEALSLEAVRRGFTFASVKPRGDRNFETHTVDVTFDVSQGAPVYVERIDIRGNTRTRDYVIRREFDLAEGDAYNQVLINRAERRLNNLGYFKTVRISTVQGSAADRVIVYVDVEDQPTGDFSVSAGYSTTDGIIGEVSVTERNFLGRGQYVRVAAQLGQYAQGFDLSFTEPFLFDYRLAGGFDLWSKYRDETQYASYESTNVGGALRLGVPVTEELGFQTRYQIYSQDIWVPHYLRDGCVKAPCDRVRERPGEASIAVLEAQGETLTSLAGYTLGWNSLDNTIDPRNGWFGEFKQDFAGLGGDVQFIRSTFDGRYYQEVVPDFIGMLRVQAGHVTAWGDDDLRLLDHFFKGPELVRGFEPQGMGPRDLTRGTAFDPLGATIYAGASAEVQFPLSFFPREFGLRGAVFADAGTAFDYQGRTSFKGYTPPGRGCASGAKLEGDLCVAESELIRSSVGASLLWASPLGPLRFDFAYAITKEDYDRTQFFRFSGGSKF
jgi:outer membrane protein insertion porin family